MATRKLKDYKPDPTNANKGTERGQYMLENSLHKYGAGRSVLADKNGYLIAGNKTLEVAGQIGIDDVIEVETDGTKLVVVKRTDLDLLSEDDKRARELAYADNRAGEVSLEWDAEQVLADLNAGIDLSLFWFENELENLMQPNNDEWVNAFNTLPDGEKTPFQQMTFTLHDQQAEIVQRAISKAQGLNPSSELNENSNGNALAFICEMFLNGNR